MKIEAMTEERIKYYVEHKMFNEFEMCLILTWATAKAEAEDTRLENVLARIGWPKEA